MIYAFLVLLGTYSIIKGVINDKINYFELSLIILILLTSRPSSIPVIFAIISFIVISKLKIFSIQKNILSFILIIFFSTPFILGLVYSFIELNYNGIAKIDFLTKMVKEGMIIHDRPETWVKVPNNFIDIVCIYFLRLINFFNPYAETFSIFHILLNSIQTIFILLSVSNWLFVKKENFLEQKIFLFIIILSFFTAAFHSFTLIDYDWRYRFPIILPLIMLIPISLEIFLKKNKLN